MVLDEHVTDAVLERLAEVTPHGLLPVLLQVERKLGEDPQLTLDLHPAGAAHERPRLVPLLHHLDARAQRLQPQVEHLHRAHAGGEGPSIDNAAPVQHFTKQVNY